MTNETDSEAYAFFMTQWRIYRKVVEQNHLAHRQLMDAAVSWIPNNTKEPLVILDLGCGDGSAARVLMDNRSFSRYIGVDGSMLALEIGQEDLAPFKERVELHHADMRDYLKTAPMASVDVILTCFALHHLPDPEKDEFLRLCRKILSPDGLLIVIDLFLQEGERRNDYLDRLCAQIRSDWEGLASSEKSHLVAHIQEYDQPSALSEFLASAAAAGFQKKHAFSEGGFFTALGLS